MSDLDKNSHDRFSLSFSIRQISMLPNFERNRMNGFEKKSISSSDTRYYPFKRAGVSG